MRDATDRLMFGLSWSFLGLAVAVPVWIVCSSLAGAPSESPSPTAEVGASASVRHAFDKLREVTMKP